MSIILINVSDLTVFAPDLDPAQAQAMIDDAVAMATRVAPCLTDDTFAYAGAAKAILRGAILRWNETGTGALSSTNLQAGPFGQTQSFDTRQQRRTMFWPSEITQLQALCGPSTGKSFGVDTTPIDTSGDGYWSAPDAWTPVVVP